MSKTVMAEKETLPWDVSEDTQWTSLVNAWEWKSLGGRDWGKSGSCPRCGRTMTIRRVSVVFATIAEQDVDLDLLVLAERGPVERHHRDQKHLFVRCNCSEEHDARPAELTGGCGRWGYIDLPPELDE